MGKKLASLAAYRRKRDFSTTSEPRGGKPGPAGLYIVQKHAASRLHYDFRLELDGTLKSWAVPKGPSVDPGTKRLAVQVEDHPVEYGGFEGVIPKGEYGGGTVMLWDRGRWEPIGDAKAGLRNGKLKFRLFGERLHGVWNLVRLGGAAGEGGKNWLLIKDRDAAAGGGEPTTIARSSVASGRTMDAIGKQATKVWSSDPSAQPRRGRARIPAELSPQLATLTKEIPAGEDWLHEVKLDGYRILAFVAGKRVRLMSRNGKDWSARFPGVQREVAKLSLRESILDGEVVALRPDGVSDFQLLQNQMRSKQPAKVAYFVFDLPFHDGQDLRDAPLVERKRILAKLLPKAARGTVRYSDHFVGEGKRVLQQACKLGLEGVVSKRADAPYESKRSPSWRKIKCSNRQEMIVAGWTEPRGSRTGFGSLLLAHHDASGRLVYSGKVGTGFDRKLLADLKRRLGRIAREKHPFDLEPPRSEVRGAHWVRPEIVVEVEFTEWTADGRLRHPAFIGIREDKDPGEVVRESAAKATPPPQRGHQVRLTHPDRVLWPEEKLTKEGLAEYYESVSERMLPHIVGRPLAIVRCPQGRGGPCFFQKHASAKSSEHLMVRDLDGLLGLVQMGALEIHPWGATAAHLDRPDRLVFDLDPGPGVRWPRVIEGAQAIRERLEELGLASFARTSGGKGLHVVVPLSRRTSWEDLKAFARGIADDLVRRDPDRYVATATKSRRRNRIFIDWLRNGEGATAIASYSTRARPGAPVAAPVSWAELPKIESGDAFHVREMAARVARAGDPWPGFFSLRQSVPASALRALARGGRAAKGA